MKKIFVISIMFFMNAVMSQVNIDNDSILLWNSTRLLSWEDFKKIKDDGIKTANGRRAHAYCDLYLGLYPSRLSCEDMDEIEVYTIFKKNSSWKIKNLLSKNVIRYNDSKLLVHEQLHFDINELFVRKIRLLIEQYKTDCNFDNFKKEYYTLLEELVITQEKYEKETRYGLDSMMQQNWNRKIDSLMKIYIEYKKDISLNDIGLAGNGTE